jgi:hypothetical protein
MHMAVDSFVQNMRNSFVQQIEPAKDAMRTEEVVKLFCTVCMQGKRGERKQRSLIRASKRNKRVLIRHLRV